MRSFALVALTFLTLGIFSFAAPVPNGGNSDGLVTVDVDADVDIDILKRADSHDNDKCLDSILHEVIEVVEVVIDEITKLGDDDCTTDILTPILKKVVKVLTIAIKDVKALLEVDVGGLLKTVTGLLDLDGLVQLICDVLTIVLKLVQLVLKLVSVVVKGELLELLCEILNLVGELLSCVFDLVSPLLGSIVHLVFKLLDDVLIKIIVELDITILIKLFGIDC